MPACRLGTINFFDRERDIKKIVDEYSALAGICIQYCGFNVPNVHELEPLRVLRREIIPVLSER